MLPKLIKKVFGSRNDRILANYKKKVEEINKLEAQFVALSDADLKNKTISFKCRIESGETLDDILVETFCTVREASKRVLGMRHFDVQLIGGMALHAGKIAEMRTGEGKTLVATLPLYLNALTGRGAHLVTVNDYLAKRDADWMSSIYGFLGLTTGIIVSNQSNEEKKKAYSCDITYGTNNEFGFDYLRDNMVFSEDERVMRELNFAVIDEVDSILIDEARTPLIISGAVASNAEIYTVINRLVPLLKQHTGELQKDEIPDGDYFIDEKNKNAIITEEGHEKIEQWLYKNKLIDSNTSLYDVQNIALLHNVNSAIKAHGLFEKNKDYIVENGEIVIIDEFTGRKLPGRRWSEGLHQAVEAKEKVSIKSESQTLASITFQNYFRLYPKLSGMTGTAETEAAELIATYNLEVVIMPTNQPNLRTDYYDLIYLNHNGKFKAIINDIKNCIEKKQPVLVGTASIDMSEKISATLTKSGIKHFVLNAKQHEKEATIIQNAGLPSSVTIATNMAGRGTDIVLGGNLDAEIANLKSPNEQQIQHLKAKWKERHQEVLNAGGLHVIGSERHESRRIDNQLRGRSGRQGDVGSTRFYLSLEDDLMRMFASERVKNMMTKLGLDDDEAIEHNWVNKAIENAQRKVEGRNYDYRKQLLEYDDVANDQRQIIYAQRKELMSNNSVVDTIENIREQVISDWVDTYIPPGSLEEQWQIVEFENLLLDELGIKFAINSWLSEDETLNSESIKNKIVEIVTQEYQQKIEFIGIDKIKLFEKAVILKSIDFLWKEHLISMDRLRQGIHLRGYAQKNPVQEYKKEAFELFEILLNDVRIETVKLLSRIRVDNSYSAPLESVQPVQGLTSTHNHVNQLKGNNFQENQVDLQRTAPHRVEAKIGRNNPCPCGSGLKYKKCHGINQ